MIKKCWIVLMLPIILASCKVGNSVIGISTVTPIVTILPTGTSTPMLTNTPTVSPDDIRYKCLEIADNLPIGESVKGVIVYNGDYNLYSWLSSQETNQTYLLLREADDTLWQYGVSPDRQYLKYIHSSARTQEDQLVIVRPDGQPVWSRVVNSIDWDWFDPERLTHTEVSEQGTHRLLLLNPFNGEQEYLPADFPDSEAFSPDWFGHWYYASRGIPVYDPTLTRTLYPAIDAKEKQATIIIWDTQMNQKVAQIVTRDNWGNTPVWTPDGKQFIIATILNSPERANTVKEFFAISRDGEVKQLTDFSKLFTQMDVIDSYSLSPNAKLLAFWILPKSDSFQDVELAVLNVETGEATNYCIKGDAFTDDGMEPSPPVWSPDSTQLLIIARIPEDTKVRRVVVVDIVNHYAAQINKDMEPVGWMVAP